MHIYFDDLKLFVLYFVFCFFANFRRVTDVSVILFFETEINAKFQNFILFWIMPLFYRFENQNERPTQIQKPNV